MTPGPEAKLPTQQELEIDPKNREACSKVAAEAMLEAASFFPKKVKEGLLLAGDPFITKILGPKPEDKQ